MKGAWQTNTSLDDWLAWRARHVSTAIQPGLERVMAAWQAIGARVQMADDQSRTASKNSKKSRAEHTAWTARLGTVITVAGTNGKGSAVHYLQAIYTAAGYTVGTYQSPELCCYVERCQWQGEPAAEAIWVQAMRWVAEQVTPYQLTLFEFDTLVALTALALQQPDITVLEIGMGGRLDAVNIIDNDIALVTTIGLDHMAYLGVDRASIAVEKCSIARAGRWLVCADQQPPDTVASTVHAIGAELQFVTPITSPPDVNGLPASLDAAVAAGILAVVAKLQAQHAVSADAIRMGLAQPGLPGRLQWLPSAGLVLDVAHNPQAAARLGNFLTHLQTDYAFTEVHWVLGMLADKAVADTLLALHEACPESLQHYGYCAHLPDEPRAIAADVLANQVHAQFGIDCSCYANPWQAYQAAEANRDSQAEGIRRLVVVTGSFRTVAGVWCDLKHDQTVQKAVQKAVQEN